MLSARYRAWLQFLSLSCDLGPSIALPCRVITSPGDQRPAWWRGAWQARPVERIAERLAEAESSLLAIIAETTAERST
jgi:hypothetical protein